jgi:hypothetical protein
MTLLVVEFYHMAATETRVYVGCEPSGDQCRLARTVCFVAGGSNQFLADFSQGAEFEGGSEFSPGRIHLDNIPGKIKLEFEVGGEKEGGHKLPEMLREMA